MNLKKLSFFILVFLVVLCNSICFANTPEPEISAEAAILIDSSTGKVFYGKNENQKMYLLY